MTHPVLSAFRDLELDPRDDARARALGAALDEVARDGLDALQPAAREQLRDLLRLLVKSARARWDDALVVRVIDEWLPREASLDVRVKLLLDRATITSTASLDEMRVTEAWQAVLAMAKKAGDAEALARAEETLEERKQRKNGWAKRAEAMRAVAAASTGIERARAMAAAAEESLRFGKGAGKKKSQGLVEANAEAELERAFDLAPADEVLARLLANVFDARRRYGDRTRVLRRNATALEGDRSPALLRVGYALARERQFDESVSVFREARALESSDPLVLDRLAASAISSDDVDTASAALEALASRGSSPIFELEALAMLVHVLGTRRGRFDLLQPFSDRLRELAPAHPALAVLDSAPAGAATAPIALPSSNPDVTAMPTPAGPEGIAIPSETAALHTASVLEPRELEALRVRLRRDPADEDARRRLKGHYRLQGPAAALVELLRYELGIAADGTESRRRTLSELCDVHRSMARNDAALIGTLSQLVALDPVDRAAAHELAGLLEKHGRWRDALLVFGKIAESEVDAGAKLEAMRTLARRWQSQMAQAPQAAEAWERVLHLAPSDDEAFAALREILTKRHAHAPLAALLEQRAASCAAVEPRHVLLLEASKLYAERLGRPEAAIAHLRSILAETPSHLSALETLERIADARRDYALLAEVVEGRVLLMNDETLRVNALQRLASLYAERLQDPVRSLATWRRVLELVPSHARAGRAVRDALVAAGDIGELERTYDASGDWDGFVATLLAASEKESDAKKKYALVSRAADVLAARHPSGEAVIRLLERLLALDPSELAPARKLVDMHENEKRFGRLGSLYEALLSGEPEADARANWRNKLVELHLDRVPDAARAWRFALESFEQSVPTPATLDALEGVARRLGRWSEFAEAIGRARSRVDGAGVFLRARLATVQARELGAMDDAIASLEALWSDGEDVFEDLERLLRGAGRADTLREAYERRLEQLDEAGRRSLLGHWALLEEEVFNDRARAESLLERLLSGFPGHEGALRSLLRFAEERAADVRSTELLGALAEIVAAPERAVLRARRARLLAHQPSGLEPAWRELRSAFDDGASVEDHLALLEQVSEHPSVAREVFPLLIAEYSRAGLSRELESTLRRCSETTLDASERRALELRRANVLGDALGQRGQAQEIAMRLVCEAPEVAGHWDALRAFSDHAEDPAGSFAKAVLSALTREPTTVPASLRASLAAEVAEISERAGDPSAALDLWRRVLDADASVDRARERGLALALGHGHDVASIDRFFLAAYGQAPGAQTLGLWAASLRAQGAVARAADRVRARIAVVGFQEDLASELEADLAATGDYAGLADALRVHAESTASKDRRAHLQLQRGELLVAKLGDPAGAVDLVTGALTEWPASVEFEALAARVADLVEASRLPLWRSLAASAAAGARDGDAARWLERVALATSDRAEEEMLLRGLVERDLVRADGERASILFERVLAIAPGDAGLRDAWLAVLRPIGQAGRFVRFAEDAYLRERSDESRRALLHGAEVCAAILDDNTRACAMLDLLRDDGEATSGIRVDASTRALRLRRPRGAHPDLVASLEHHLGLELSHETRVDTLRELATCVDAMGGSSARAFERWSAVANASLGDCEARRRVIDLAEALERYEDAVSTIRDLLALDVAAEERGDLALRRAVLQAEKLHDPRRALADLAAFPCADGFARAVAQMTASIAERAGFRDELVIALHRLIELQSVASERAALRVRLARVLLETDEHRGEAVDVANAALDDDPAHRAAAEVLRSLLAGPETRARAAEFLIARYANSTESPDLLAAALEARATTTRDDEEAVEVLGRAATLTEDRIGDAASAFRLRLEAFKRAPAGAVANTLDEALRLSRAVGSTSELVAAIETRLSDVDHAAFPEVCDASIGAARKLSVDARRALAWLDVRLAGRGATPQLLEERLVFARETLDPALILEALDRVDDARVGVDERSSLEAERLVNLDAIDGREGEAVACLFRLVELRGDSARIDDLRNRLSRARNGDAALDLEERVRSRGEAAVENRVESLLISSRVASEWRGDVQLALSFLEEALGLAPADARVAAALLGVLHAAPRERETAIAIARLQERSARARGDFEAVVASLELQRKHAEGPDALLDEAIAEARLSRGDTNDTLASAWVALLRQDPTHERARRGLDALASTDSRMVAAEGLAGWLRTQLFDDDATAALCEFTALEFVRAERRSEAGEFLLRAFRANPLDRADRFGLLDDLLAERGDTAARVELHRERAMEALDGGARYERLLVLADLEEQRDGDARRARETFEEALEVGEFDLAAVAALERIYTAQEDWHALFELLQRRLDRAQSSAERQRLRRRLVEVACDRLNLVDEACNVVVAWLADDGAHAESRQEAGAMTVLLLAREGVRARLVAEAEPLLRAADGDARTRILEAAADLEATRADAAPRWLELAKHLFDVRGDETLALRSLARSFAGDPRSEALRQVAREFGARMLDWAQIAGAFESALPEFEPWERRDAVLSLVEILDEDAGDPRRALAVLDVATASPDADDALHAKADELSMLLADWRANVVALRRRAAATLDGEVRTGSLRRAATVAREELADATESLSILEGLLGESEDEDDLAAAVALARELHNEAALLRYLPRLLDARGWRGDGLEADALDLATRLEQSGARVDEVVVVLERALDGGAPRPRIIVALLEALRRAGRFEELARALEVEADRCFEPIHAAPIHDERSLILDRELRDERGSFAAACAACDALPTEARFARVVFLGESHASLLAEALRFVSDTPGSGRDDALWRLLDGGLRVFEGDERLDVARRLGAMAWERGRSDVAADAWLVALQLAPESDPFEVDFEARAEVLGVSVLHRYADALAEVERDALDPAVSVAASLKRGALLVERLGRPTDAVASLSRADEGGIEPSRTLELLVRALEVAEPSSHFAAVLERSAEFVVSRDERAARLARAAAVRGGLGDDPDGVLDLASRALEASPQVGESLTPLLEALLGNPDLGDRASSLLDEIFRGCGDRAGRMRLRRAAIVRSRDVAERLAAQLAFVDLALDLDGPFAEALDVVIDAALIDSYANDVFTRFVSVLQTNVDLAPSVARIATALRASSDGAAGLAPFAHAVVERGSGLDMGARLLLARACAVADPENLRWLATLESMLLERAPDRELVDVLVARARLEADEDGRLSCLRRALALATEVLQDVAVGEDVLTAWASIDENGEYFAARVAFAEARGRSAEALTWSRRGAEECFDVVAQKTLWHEHADRALRAGVWGEALTAFEQLLLHDPSDSSLQLRQREALRNAGDFEALARALEDHALSVEKDERRVDLLLELAAIAEGSLDDVERARDALRRALETGVRGADVLGAARALAGRTNADAWLVEVLETAADLACAQDAPDAQELGISLLLEASDTLRARLGDPSGALERLERARAIDLGDPRVSSKLVHLARELGRWELAIDVLEQQVERDPSRGSFADLVATADASRESWLVDRALDVWRRLAFDGGELEEQLYDALLRDERHDEARVFLEERTARLRGRGCVTEAREVVVRALEKARERTIDLLEVAVRVDPDNDALLIELAARLVDDGRSDDARAHLEHALRIVPPGEAQSVLHVMLGRIARDQWDLERARSHFDAARVLRPDAALPLRELMATCQEAGDAPAAMKHGKALLLLPLDETTEVPRSDALAALARLYEDEGERAKASELYARAVDSNAAHEEGLRGLARTR